jgi:hypothetical protein
LTERGESLASQLGTRLAELDALVASLQPSQLALISAEGWPVGFVAFHITLGLVRQRRWIERRLRGGTIHKFDWDTTNELNRRLSRRIGVLDVAAVRHCVRERGDALIALARQLTDPELDTTAFAFNEHQRSVEWVIRRVALRHIDDHVASIRAALAG